MSATQKKKLCWNCEGSAPLHLDNCPFCGVYLNRTADEEGEERIVHTPPYQLVSPVETENTGEEEKAAGDKVSVAAFSSLPETKDLFLSFFFLLTGALLLFFGLLLLLFSRQGTFTLQWDGSYWPFYLSVAVPLLFFGLYSLRRLD
jgi:hypothetical protein